jgi:hypothetical protein
MTSQSYAFSIHMFFLSNQRSPQSERTGAAHNDTIQINRCLSLFLPRPIYFQTKIEVKNGAGQIGPAVHLPASSQIGARPGCRLHARIKMFEKQDVKTEFEKE